MSEKRDRSTGGRQIMVGVGLIILFVFLDILVDVYWFHEGTFLSQLLTPGPYEIYVRGLIIIIIVATIMYARYMTLRLDDTNSQLKTELYERTQVETELRTLFASMHDVVLVIDRDGIYRKVAPTDPGLLYRPPEELLGKKLQDVFPLEEAKTFISIIQKVLKTRQTHQIEYKLIIGESSLWFDTTISPMMEDSTLWVARDITERKQAEEQLRESEFFFKESQRVASIGSYKIDFINGCWESSPVLDQIFGIDKSYDRSIQGWLDIIHPDDREMMARYLREEVISKHKPFDKEYRIIRKSDGKTRWASGLGEIGFDAEGNTISMIGTIQDITIRKSAEVALLDASEMLVRNVTELEQRNLEISLLNKMVASFQASLTLEEVFAIVEQASAQLFPDKAGALFRLNPSRNLCEPMVAWGFSSTQSLPTAFSPKDCPVLRDGQLHFAESGHPSNCQHSLNGFIAAHLCIPLIAHRETIGVMSVQNEDKSDLSLTPAKQQLAYTVADTTALAIANLELRETLRQQSIRDPLTGLFNRRYLEETLEREVRRAARNHQSVGIIMIDIDFFKVINDTYGHEAGDVALHELGGFLIKHVRQEDIACRYGGEEFILILPGATLLTTHGRAEVLQDGIRRLHILYSGQELKGLTVSCGVAVFPDHGSNGMAVIRSADMALYRAKQAGRDRIETGRDEETRVD